MIGSLDNNNNEDEDDDFDMDEDSDADSSQDDETSIPSSSSSSTTTSTPNNQNKRPITQALFLNFTSDLSPQKMNKKKSKPKKQTAYRVNGVNILNRNNLDSKTAIERIQRRRENHNHVERRRRDNINNTIFELSSVVPNAIQPGQKPNKGNILKLSLDYIRDLQAENKALKERLNHHSPPLSDAALSAPTTPASTTMIAVMPAVDESFSNNNFQQQSPSTPNSPTRFVRNTMFTQQQQQQQPSSVPSSPLHIHMPKEDITIIHCSSNLPPPLALPPPHQQQLQNGFSTMSVSSNSSSAASTPILSASNTFYTNTYQQQQQQQQQPQSSIYIPQPPQLYNHHEVFNTQQPQQHKLQGLRPLLPATTTAAAATSTTQQQTSFLPALRMGGYEKIYGNVCRY
ncbi:hypothetical protein HPULCUR_001718 [Helicostylum pulchrum]|uniref:BHLH domain-containing protein n=1 Tax=Helicostylum pulchrum TaxID=562976 RepID=A0ABP9XNH1_9FUNG